MAEVAEIKRTIRDGNDVTIIVGEREKGAGARRLWRIQFPKGLKVTVEDHRPDSEVSPP